MQPRMGKSWGSPTLFLLDFGILGGYLYRI